MKTWTTAEREYLLTVTRQGWTMERMARRFACTEHDILRELAVQKTNLTPPEAIAKLKSPDGRTIIVSKEDLMEALTPMQKKVIELGGIYKSMGDHIHEFNDYIAAALSEVELAELIAFLLKKPRSNDESVHEKLARLLCQQFIIIPKEINDPNQEPNPIGKPPPAAGSSGHGKNRT